MSHHDARLRAILDLATDGLVIADEIGTITDFNAAAERMFGYRADEVVGQNLQILMPEPFRSQHPDYMRRYRETGIARVIGSRRDVTGQRKDGTVFPIQFRLHELRYDGRRQFVGLVYEQSEKAWRQINKDGDQRRLDDFTSVASEWFWETDAENRITFLSERYFHDTGEVPASLLGRYPWDVGFTIDPPAMLQRVKQATRDRVALPTYVAQRTTPNGDTLYCQIAGIPRFLPDGTYLGYCGTGHDVTELERRNRELQRINKLLDEQATEMRFLNETLENQSSELVTLAETAETARLELETEIAERQKLERQLREMAMSDSLTGAANRRAFLDTADRELARAVRHRRPLSIVAIDIDHFKAVNDTYGHAAGDAVLQAVAQLCREQLRSADEFGRLGGEEFAALLPETSPKAAKIAAEHLRAAVADLRVPFGDDVIAVTSSFGVATLQPTDRDFATFLRRADQALYAAKHAGRNCVVADEAATPQLMAR